MATHRTATRDELLAEARDIAVRLGKRTLSRAEFERESGVSDRQVTKHFDSWNDFVQAAGLEP